MSCSDNRIIRLWIPGEAVGKGRPRFGRLPNGAVTTFTPNRTRTYEGIIRTIAMEHLGGFPPMTSAIALQLEIRCDVPASWPAWKQALALDGTLWPTTRPDADNVEKAVKDALNGVVWRDDCQIVDTRVRKVYASAPGVLAEIAPLSGFPCQIKRASVTEGK